MKKIFALTPETEAEKKARQAQTAKSQKEQPVIAPVVVSTPAPLKTKNLRLWGDRVLIKQAEAKAQVNGIIVPESAKRKPSNGTVIGKGPKCAEAIVGEDVYFGKYAGTVITLREGEQFKYEGKLIPMKPEEELLIMREADVFMSETDD